MDILFSTTISGISGVQRHQQQKQAGESNNDYPKTSHLRRRLTGYCGWKIWNGNSGKTCDQVALELASDGTMQVSQAKSMILTEGCVCEIGEASFDNDKLDTTAFCGRCQYKDATFSCDDRVEFVMTNYPEDNPTKAKAKMNLLKRGECFDRNWTPYATKMQVNGGGGLSGGAIGGIVIAAIALCGASIVGFCILRDSKKVKSEEEEDKTTIQVTSSGKPIKTSALNVIEEGDEDEEEGESESGAAYVVSTADAVGGAPQSKDDGVGIEDDDQTEIIANGNGNGGNEK